MTAHRTRHGYSMLVKTAQTLLEQTKVLPNMQAALETSENGENARLHLQYAGRRIYVNSERNLESILLAWSLDEKDHQCPVVFFLWG